MTTECWYAFSTDSGGEFLVGYGTAKEADLYEGFLDEQHDPEGSEKDCIRRRKLNDGEAQEIERKIAKLGGVDCAINLNDELHRQGCYETTSPTKTNEAL
jgi:hypothetical protein